MKCGQQFEIYKMLVCTKFRRNSLLEFGFRVRKPLRKFDVKIGLKDLCKKKLKDVFIRFSHYVVDK